MTDKRVNGEGVEVEYDETTDRYVPVKGEEDNTETVDELTVVNSPVDNVEVAAQNDPGRSSFLK